MCLNLKFFILFCFLPIFITNKDDNEYTEEYYDQYIDHFNFYSYKNLTFKQRYLYLNKDFNHINGSLLFYTGNEGDITSFWNNTGSLFDFAYLVRGFIVFAEHRFYGKSLPFGAKSFDSNNIGLLSVDQALADFAELIRYIFIKFKLNPKIPVITFGGSYGGILSTYMRLKYPNLVEGSISSSAPLMSVAGLVPRNFFFKRVTEIYLGTNRDCVHKIRNGFADIDKNLCDGLHSARNLTKELKLCRILDCKKDGPQLYNWIRNAFVILSMCNYPYPSNFLAALPPYPVKASCHLLKKLSTPMEGIYKILSLVYNTSGLGDKKCFDLYTEYKICADPTGCGLGQDGKAWDYQSCTDFILPSGSDNVTDMFPRLPFTIQQRREYCKATWNVEPRDHRLALNFWGDHLGTASNIIFSNGDLDPWMPGGILKNVSSSIISIVIEGGAHHLDLRGSRGDDTDSVKHARQIELGYIQKWISSSKSGIERESDILDDIITRNDV
ncbi:dipeptidyl peptidase 2-like [Gordionus sp. m RMFG-2023]|uniref:dipeptidyl peptidase 2-like n=1 Tax=Gordionus sp. m RMFG-2023 TaxID=3053472 RepID=UPI0031FBD0ED